MRTVWVVAGEKRARTRRRLVEAAFAVVAERGFHGASVDLIAGRADLSTGALYAHFASKDALLLAAFEEHLAWFAERLEATLRAPDVREAVGDWVRALGREREQFLVFVEFWAYALRRPELRPELAARMAAMQAEVTAAIEERSRSAGAPPPLPPALAAHVALALARGLAFEAATDPASTPDAAIADLLGELVSPSP